MTIWGNSIKKGSIATWFSAKADPLAIAAAHGTKRQVHADFVIDDSSSADAQEISPADGGQPLDQVPADKRDVSARRGNREVAEHGLRARGLARLQARQPLPKTTGPDGNSDFWAPPRGYVVYPPGF